METKKPVNSAFLPVGVAFGLLAGAFTFDDSGVQWMWQSQPPVSLVLALFGLSLVAVHLVRRVRTSRQR